MTRTSVLSKFTISTDLQSDAVCPVCGSESRFESGFCDIQLFRCLSCDHCFTDVNSLGALEQYSRKYFVETHRNWFRNPDTNFFESLYQAILAHNPAASVLDVGCGTGNLLRYLRHRNPRLTLTGIDFTRNALTDGIEFVVGDLFAWPTRQKFDVVVSLQVIEHLAEPRRFVNRLTDLSNDGGLVIIDTINERNLLYEVARTLYRYGKRRPYERLYSRHHLNHFSFRSMERLLTNGGLKVTRHAGHSAPISAMDIPSTGRIERLLLKLLVTGIFKLAGLTGKPIYQTAFSTPASRPQAT